MINRPLRGRTPEELERAFIASHCSEDGVRAALEAGIDADSFAIEAHSAAWGYLVQRVRDGVLPTLHDLTMAAGLSLPSVVDGQPWREELALRTIAQRTRRTLLENVASIEEDPMTAVRAIVGGLQTLAAPRETNTVLLDGDAVARYEGYLAMRQAISEGHDPRWPTGLDVFDRAGRGYKAGELVGIIGRPNAGKSWLLHYKSAVAYLAGARVLTFSPESTLSEVQYRIDPILSRRLGIVLSNEALEQGTQDPEVYQRYTSALALRQRSDWSIVDSGDAGSFTIEDVVTRIRAFRPDFVALDGFHLVEAGGETWKDFKSIARTLKGLGQSLGHVTVVVSQLQRQAVQAGDDNLGDLGDSAYGMGLEETANRILYLAQRRGDPSQRLFKIIKFRGARFTKDRQYLRFDVDSGNIGQYTPLADEDTGEVSFFS